MVEGREHASEGFSRLVSFWRGRARRPTPLMQEGGPLLIVQGKSSCSQGDKVKIYSMQITRVLHKIHRSN